MRLKLVLPHGGGADAVSSFVETT